MAGWEGVPFTLNPRKGPWGIPSLEGHEGSYV